jgi:DNA invertase Pin-like site-specific DNA recombinase
MKASPAQSSLNLRRPGLQLLLEDVRLGLIDVVVVHRLDRLTRHLGDVLTQRNLLRSCC